MDCSNYVECKGHGNLKVSHCAECTLEAAFEGIRRWATMMQKNHPELFGDEGRQFYDDDELVASLQSFMIGLDLKQ